MRRALGAGLATLIAVRAGGVHADPGAPQVNQAHVQREDSLRIDAQQRRLDAEGGIPAPGTAAVEPPQPPAPVVLEPPASPNRKRVTAFVLFGVAGVSAVLAASFFETNLVDPHHNHDTANGVGSLLGVAAAVSAVIGVATLLSSRQAARMQVAPAMTTQSVGLVIRRTF